MKIFKRQNLCSSLSYQHFLGIIIIASYGFDFQANLTPIANEGSPRDNGNVPMESGVF